MSFTTLISATELASILPDCHIFDCQFNLADSNEGEAAYQARHIPGARYAHLDRDLSSPITEISGRHPLPDFHEFIRQIEAWAIHQNTQIIAYDNTSGTFAARLWWLLKTIGHTKVAVLNGGFQAWQQEGLPTSSEPNTFHLEPTSYPSQINKNSWVDVEVLQQQLQNGTCTLIDARTAERFSGAVEAIDTLAGHIPGAFNQALPHNLNEQGYFYSVEQLRHNYAPYISNNPNKDIIHMCGSGVFACHSILTMEFAGLGQSKLYPGSWSEWIRDKQRPIATGN